MYAKVILKISFEYDILEQQEEPESMKPDYAQHDTERDNFPNPARIITIYSIANI